MSELSPLLDDLPSLRLESIAVSLNCSLATVLRLIADEKLQAVRIGSRALRVRPSELARFLSNSEQTGNEL